MVESEDGDRVPLSGRIIESESSIMFTLARVMLECTN